MSYVYTIIVTVAVGAAAWHYRDEIKAYARAQYAKRFPPKA